MAVKIMVVARIELLNDSKELVDLLQCINYMAPVQKELMHLYDNRKRNGLSNDFKSK